MTPALSRSFAQQNGIRGVHFCDEADCRFAPWGEVVAFCNQIMKAEPERASEFEDKLLEIMMALNPDNEYAVVKSVGSAVHIEC